MSTVHIHLSKPHRKPSAMQDPLTEPGQKPPTLTVSLGDDLHALIEKRAYKLYSERGYREGYALDDWLDAEREIRSQTPVPDGIHNGAKRFHKTRPQRVCAMFTY